MRTTLAGLLRRVPGARVREYGGVGAFATLSLRASTADQVPVYVDGILQNRSFGGPFNLASVPDLADRLRHRVPR